ncbi:MAG TPA: hypothetical protein VI454_14400 [Verrucomicrobiae bacterium]|jgi:hypothetical protein
MNPKRLLLAIVVVFVGVFATDFIIHGVLLQKTYAATMSLWRPEAEMQAHMPWMSLAQLLAATTFVVLYAAGFASTATVRSAAFYGLFMGLFSQVMTLVLYTVQPMPPGLAVKWFVTGIAQNVVLGVIVFFAYKPKPVAVQSNP